MSDTIENKQFEELEKRVKESSDATKLKFLRSVIKNCDQSLITEAINLEVLSFDVNQIRKNLRPYASEA